MPLTPEKVKHARDFCEQGRRGKLSRPGNKLVAALALLYLISPIDLLPDWLFPIIGWLDDLGVIGLAALWIARHRAPQQEDSPQQQSPRGPSPQA